MSSCNNVEVTLSGYLACRTSCFSIDQMNKKIDQLSFCMGIFLLANSRMLWQEKARLSLKLTNVIPFGNGEILARFGRRLHLCQPFQCTFCDLCKHLLSPMARLYPTLEMSFEIVWVGNPGHHFVRKNFNDRLFYGFLLYGMKNFEKKKVAIARKYNYLNFSSDDQACELEFWVFA